MLKSLTHKKNFLLAIIFAWLVIIPISALAVEEPVAEPAECTVDKSAMNDEEKALANRKCEDAKALAKDRKTIQDIRDTSTEEAITVCQSEYSPDSDGEGGGGGGGQFVPVHETGKLLTLTTSTNELTTGINEYVGKSYNMDILLCKYLYEIKRVQFAMEDLTFVKEPDMRRQAATDIEEYKKALLGEKGLIQTGYKPSGKLAEAVPIADRPTNTTLNKNSLYPENLESNLLDAREEGGLKFLDDLNNYSSNSFADEVSTQLIGEAESNIDPSIDSYLTRDRYNDFYDPEKNKALSDDEWWNTFLSIFDSSKPNNPNTAYFLAKQGQLAEQNKREALAILEYQANQGFLPIRECISYTTDGLSCRVWKTISPGQIVQQSASQALNTKLEQYLDPQLGTIGEGNEPVVSEVDQFSPIAGQGGGTTGGTGGGGGNGNNDPSNPDQPDDPDQPPQAPPAVFITVNSSPDGNSRIITWGTANVRSCKAGNDWLGSLEGTDPINLVGNIKEQNTNLDKNGGKKTFSQPLDFNPSWTKTLWKDNDEFVTTGMSSTTNADNTSKLYTWVVSGTDVHFKDKYILKITDRINRDGVKYKVWGETDAVGIVKQFEKGYREDIDDKIILFTRYRFDFDTTPGSAKIKMEVRPPVYKITCTGKNGDIVTDEAN